ncbi:DsbA family protein [Parvularcula sp. LCG005]|uniref:DsbA family protein n=1 Tax=Parvularcula sp. LCG005 TaxID=3078805 RepID=UPI00294275C8|nr:DsbA family protein [Parvularcula sp. LCG005]WOI53144.1 DsbA family protein [Parvularcula sp. LCG005]
MSTELRVYFHFRSPYSRLGLYKLLKADIEDAVPTRLHILTKAAGTDDPINPGSTPARRAYLMQDVPRATMEAGLPISFPRPFDMDYMPAYSAFYAAREAGAGLAFATALSNSRWSDGSDVSDQAVIDEALSQAGLQPGLSVDDAGAQLAADTAMLEKDGAFGVPFAVLDADGRLEKFWGQDRFDLLIRKIKS